MILIESSYPGDGSVALLEDDGRTVYLYLSYDGDDGPYVPLWVANRVPAPKTLELDGEPPLNPVEHCAHPEGLEPFAPDRLEIVWFPEGDGVAVYESGSLLAAIPGWTGVDEFIGYAREARGHGPLAWELSKDSALHARLDAARRYWQSWEEKPDPWQRAQPEQLKALETQLGKPDPYFAIDGGRWPPKALVRIGTEKADLWVTVGMSVRPMPAVERFVEDPRPLRRIELGMVLPPETGEALMETLGDYVSQLTNLPWRQRTWLGQGHTIPCQELEALGYPAVALLAATESNYPVELPPFDGDPVTLLWLVPITADEWARAKAESTEAVLSGVRLPRSFDGEKPPS